MDDRSRTPATADLDRDGLVGDRDEDRNVPDAGGGGGSGMTVAEVGADGGGSRGAQAAQIKRERTGATGVGSEDIGDPLDPNSR